MPRSLCPPSFLLLQQRAGCGEACQGREQLCGARRAFHNKPKVKLYPLSSALEPLHSSHVSRQSLPLPSANDGKSRCATSKIHLHGFPLPVGLIFESFSRRAQPVVVKTEQAKAAAQVSPGPVC